MGTAKASAIRGLLASANVFTTAANDLMSGEWERLTGRDLTFSQLKVLKLVARSPAASVSDVAAVLGVSTAAASKAVDRLVRSGHLRRRASVVDRRSTEITLTDRAWVLLDEYDAATGAILAGVFDGVAAGTLRAAAATIDGLTATLASGGLEGTCFRCGIHFQDDSCVLRTAGASACLLQTADRAPAPSGSRS